MGILSFFRNRREASPSAAVAKGRLQVLIAHERTNRNGPEYLPQLKQDIVDVIKKYVNVGEDQVMVKIDSQDNREVLELNITLPEDSNVEVAKPAETASTNADGSAAQTSTNGNGSDDESGNAASAKAAAAPTSSSSQNGKSNGNGKKKSRSSGKKNKGNKKSRRK